MNAIFDAIKSIIEAIGSVYDEAVILKGIVFSFLGIWTFHAWFFRVLGFFATRRFKKTDNYHKYAIVVAARNEEKVICNLLESIKRQDYPADKLTVFVVADNCTDGTARVAREHGAVCYERFDSEHKTKGFALQFLFENIRKDYGIEAFEGYFVFDADNLLNGDYITKMNEAFDEGEKIITSYRNTKNFDENWIASTYAIHWLRSIRSKHRARSVLRLATNIQGTGFLFANELMKDGWNYTSLTEDRAFTADAVAHGYPISYCDAAEFFDEQPTSLRVALRQRIRWSKGHLLAFAETGPALIKNIFVGNSYRDRSIKRPMTWKRIAEGIRTRFASFDTLSQLIPFSLFYLFFWLLISVFMFACNCFVKGIDNLSLFAQSPLLEEEAVILAQDAEGVGAIVEQVVVSPAPNNLVEYIIDFFHGDFIFNVSSGFAAFFVAIGIMLLCNFINKVSKYFGDMIMAIYVFIVERKRIIKIPIYKKILYVFTWPIFDIIGKWTTYAALFMKVEWKPIPHTSSVTIEDIEGKKEDMNYESVHEKELISKK